ncbi:MAG TPA: hypothetical protein VGG39_21065 [Polyangiaceae bacterium]|jgi:hypothetical protein
MAEEGDRTTGREGMTQQADPFAVFVQGHRRGMSRRGPRFNSGEHVWLGGAGAERARVEVSQLLGVEIQDEVFTSIRRRVARESLQYGELVALSGDFYESPGDLFDEKPSPFPLLSGQTDIDGLRKGFAVELDWIEAREHAVASRPYPDETLRFAWSAKSYLELALRNVDHFGWHNVRAYVRHHEEALRLAASARGADDETWRRALCMNAFADHFLTDGFAAGHVRVPRAEICAWAEARGLNDKVSGSLSKILHDQDGHVDTGSLHGVVDESRRPADDGLAVEDSTGARWFTRCDGQLFLGPERLPAVERPTLAVAASVEELLLAWLRSEHPRGVFEATKYVPFPRDDTPALSAKFGASMSEAERTALWKSVSWYAKIPWLAGLEREHLDALLEALPGLMDRFRGQVAADIAGDPAGIARIAPRYVQAYARLA